MGGGGGKEPQASGAHLHQQTAATTKAEIPAMVHTTIIPTERETERPQQRPQGDQASARGGLQAALETATSLRSSNMRRPGLGSSGMQTIINPITLPAERPSRHQPLAKDEGVVRGHVRRLHRQTLDPLRARGWAGRGGRGSCPALLGGLHLCQAGLGVLACRSCGDQGRRRQG